MTNTIEKQHHEAIKKSLFEFMNTHIPGGKDCVVDEYILSYVVSVLEDASQDDAYDVEEFMDMMSAYFPKFADIEAETVCAWIINLNNHLANLNKMTGPPDVQNLSLNSLSLTELIPKEKLCGRKSSESEGTGANNEKVQKKRVQNLSETSDGGSTDSDQLNCDLFGEECDILQEMFPDSSFIEIKHCITIANGDINKATQIILHRQETGESLQHNSLTQSARAPVVNETDMKKRIIERYSYVDKVDTREYKPVVPKVEPKKLVRYRDNKIVSLKGERYTEVSRRDEEAELKKPKRPIVP